MAKTSLLSQWKTKNQGEKGAISIEKAPEGTTIPLSHGQRRLWFLQQLYPDSPFYNYSECYVFKGTLIQTNLIKALNQVCNDHGILRSTYQINDGEPFIQVALEAQIQIVQYDFSHEKVVDAETAAKKVMTEDAQRPFDLSEHPIIRVSLIKIHETKHLMLLTLHHISTDKWSMGLLRDELAKHYKDLCFNKALIPANFEIQYADYTYWKQNQSVDQKQLTYWKQKLYGEIKPIHLPVDYRKPAVPTFQGGASPTHYFSEEFSSALLALAKKLEVTPYVLFLSVYYVLLYRYSGQNDILIGSPVASRDEKAIEKLIGFFNDTVVLRGNVLPDMPFKTFVQEVKQLTLEAFSNKDVPFDTLVKELKQERSLSINPFFQVMFLYHAVPETPSFGTDLELEHNFFDAGVSKFDLTLYISEEKGILSSTFEYASDLFKPESIERFQEHFRNILDHVVQNLELTLGEIPLLSKEERQLLQEHESDLKNPLEHFNGIHDAIAKSIEKCPSQPAVSFMKTSVTYRELDERATHLASHILSKTKKRNEIVGLCVERSLDMIIGMYAILKAGCAYLPIDPKYPAQRIDFMLQDADVKTIVTQEALYDLFEAFDAKLIDVAAEVDQEVIEFPKVDKDDLAYMIYTSGSTGKPKGVPITHNNILNATGGRLDFYESNPKAFLLLSSISFDSSKAGIFWTLCTGGNLVIAENRIEQDIKRIGDLIYQYKITHTLMLPSVYKLILEFGDVSRLGSLDTVMVAGEACSIGVCQAHFGIFKDVKLYNEYGPTEATVWCIAHKVEKSDITETVPIGRPVANATIYLLDENKNQVPFGVPGEIYVGGPGLASGYFKRPELSSVAFVENPFVNSESNRLYKTGDLAKYSSDGNIIFLGRLDQQVKIRGYRIEVNEIENSIANLDGVEQAVVIVESFGANDSKRLIAYITSKSDLNIELLKLALKEHLPEYMVPTSIFLVPKIPVLPNGKVDKVSLKKNIIPKFGSNENNVKEPLTRLESELVRLWKEVLQIEEVEVTDNFFDLGGDSILSIQFIAKARKEGLVLSPNQIFDYQTISELAKFLEAKETKKEEWDYLVALRKEGAKKPLFCIHAGGGHIFFYNVLTKHIDSSRPIYALQASGVYANQNMHETIEEMAADYLKAMRSVQPNGPYNIVVYCFSVAVGHQIAFQLSKQGQMANLIVMDTMADPWNLNTPKRLKMRFKGFVKRSLQNPVESISSMFKDRWVHYRARFNIRNAAPEEKALLEMNANLAKICKVYNWTKVQAKVSIVLTEKAEASINAEIVDSWKEIIEGEIQMVKSNGVHRDLFLEPDIKNVSKKIDAFAID